MISKNILDIGIPTPIIMLSERSTRGIDCQVLVKLESQLPSGTSADRVASAMVEEAMKKAGERNLTTLVVAAQSGNLGLSLALYAAVKGFKLLVAVPDKISHEKIEVMKALGARVHVCQSTLPPDHEESYRSVAERLARDIPGALLIDPLFSDAAQKAHQEMTGKEIFEQTGGRLDAVVVPLETGSTASGIGRFLKEKIKDIKIFGAEPTGSLYRDFVKLGRVGEPCSSLVEGAGCERIAGTLDTSILDDVIQVSDPDALRMARKLARNEGILTGGAGGLCVAATLEKARDMGKDERILAVLPDTGLYYVSRIYNEAWMQANQILGGAADKTLFDVLSSKKDDPGALISITPDEPLSEAITRMKKHEISQLPVLTRDGSPVGSLWEGMVIDIMVKGKDTHTIPVREVMAEPFPIMEMETPIVEAIRSFGPRVPAILVKRTQGNYAIITKHDLLQGLTA